MNLPGHADEDAEARNRCAGRHPDGVAKVHRRIAAEHAGRQHRAGDHDRHVDPRGQIEEIRRLLQSVGAVGNDDAVDPFARGASHRRGQPGHVREGHERAGHVEEVEHGKLGLRDVAERPQHCPRQTDGVARAAEATPSAMVPPVEMIWTSFACGPWRPTQCWRLGYLW